MHPIPALLDHRVLLFLAFSGGGDQEVLPHTDGGPLLTACDRGDEPNLRLYLTAGAHEALHTRRFAAAGEVAFAHAVRRAAHEGEATEVKHVGRATVAEVCRVEPDLGLLCLVLKLDGRPELADLLDVLDAVRMRGPAYVDQQLPRWSVGGEAVGQGLAVLLESMVPGAAPVFEDQRCFCFAYAALAADPGPDLRYALCAADPQGMPPPPADVVERFFLEHAYRRWEAAGTLWAFAHRSGGAIHLGDAAPWLGALFENQYLDLLSWAAIVAAHRRSIAAAMQAGTWPLESQIVRHLRRYEWERLTEQDQGREVLRLWLHEIDRDFDDRSKIRMVRT